MLRSGPAPVSPSSPGQPPSASPESPCSHLAILAAAPRPFQARFPSPPAPGRSGFRKRERTESKTSWRPTAISCTFCKCHRVKINRPPLRPAGSPRTHDSAPSLESSLPMGPADPPFPRAPWSPAPLHSSASHHALLCLEARPQVTRWPGPLPFGAPMLPTSHSSLCSPPGTYFSRASLDSGLPFPKC